MLDLNTIIVIDFFRFILHPFDMNCCIMKMIYYYGVISNILRAVIPCFMSDEFM